MKGRQVMTLDEKVEEIKEAVKSGVPKRRIGVGCASVTMRKVLEGEKVSDKMIEKMYANLQAYRENRDEREARREKYRDANPEISKGKKIEEIKEAVKSGIAKYRLDPFGGGDAVRKLMNGKSVGVIKINEIYANLLVINNSLKTEREQCTTSSNQNTQDPSAVLPKAEKRQKRPSSEKTGSDKNKGKKEDTTPKNEEKTREKTRKDSGQNALENDGQLHKKVLQQEKQIAELSTKVIHLEETVREITEFMGSNKRRPMKVLGITVTQKTDKVGDKKYRRWYGIYRGIDGKEKARWIYIGKDVTRAEEKIKAWFEKNERKQ